MRININNFYDPSEKYLKEWSDMYDARLLFNADLINFAYLFLDPKENINNIDSLYNGWCKYYQVNITKNELIDKFKQYSEVDFVNLMQHIYNNSNE